MIMDIAGVKESLNHALTTTFDIHERHPVKRAYLSYPKHRYSVPLHG